MQDIFDANNGFRNELSSEEMVKLIFDFAGRIGNEKKLQELLKLMANLGRELIVADRCSVWLWDKDTNELWTTVAHGVEELRIPYGTGIVGYSIANNEKVFINNAPNDQRFNPAPDMNTGYCTKSILVIPILNNEGNVVGAFQAINKMTIKGIFSDYDIEKLEMIASYSGKSLESALLYEEIEETQREIVFLMCEISESRFQETGNHVKRVSEYSKLLATLLGMSEEEAELLKEASPLHDIGKVAIPDSILKKPGKLTPEEFEVMKTHSDVGYNLLNKSKRKIISTAAMIANQHHEKYNGNGYPRSLKGEEIHIFARITALADVFDALASERCYKPAWGLDRIINLIRAERGQQFCPKVTDAFLNNLDKFLEIKSIYKD